MDIAEIESKFSFMCLLCKDHQYFLNENDFDDYLIDNPIHNLSKNTNHASGFCYDCHYLIWSVNRKENNESINKSIAKCVEKINGKILNIHQLVIDHQKGVQNVYGEFSKYRTIVDNIRMLDANQFLDKLSTINSSDLMKDIQTYKKEFLYPAQYYASLLESVRDFKDGFQELLDKLDFMMKEFKKV